MKYDLAGIDVRSIVIPMVFITPNPKAESIRKAEEGLRDLELAVITILDQGVSPYALKLNDIAKLIGTTGKKMAKHITEAQQIAHDSYDGKFDPPEVINVERLIYFIAAFTITEMGRISKDLTEYTVRTSFDGVFEISAIHDTSDFAAWCFLVDYFEHCLDYGKVAITTYLKNYGNSMMTRNKLKNFIKRNYWYEDFEEFATAFGTDIFSAPSLKDVADAGYEYFYVGRCNVDQRNTKDIDVSVTTSA